MTLLYSPSIPIHSFSRKIDNIKKWHIYYVLIIFLYNNNTLQVRMLHFFRNRKELLLDIYYLCIYPTLLGIDLKISLCITYAKSIKIITYFRFFWPIFPKKFSQPTTNENTNNKIKNNAKLKINTLFYLRNARHIKELCSVETNIAY